MKRFRLLYAALTALALTLASCEKEAPVSISFASPTYQMTVGRAMELSGELKVSNTDGTPEFSSSAPQVAAVDGKGKLTAQSAGKAVITATVEGASATCEVQVTEVKAGKITITAPEAVVAEQWCSIKAEVDPEDFNEENLTWTFTTSDDGPEVETEKVSASEYRLMFKTFVQGGCVTVKVADSNSDMQKSAVISVTEKPVEASRIVLEMPEELRDGQWGTVTAVVTPEDYNAENLVWEFTPGSVEPDFEYEKVSASEYKVRFKSYTAGGSITIVVSDKLSNAFAQGRIKVLDSSDVDFSITLVPADQNILTAGLMQDNTVKLNAFYTKTENNTEYSPKQTSWTSSDNSVATVDSEGNVTAVIEHIEKKGIDNGHKVTITHVADKKSASIELTVVKVLPTAVMFTEIPSVNGVEYRIMHGDTFTFKGKVLPEKADQTVVFTATHWGTIGYETGTFTASILGKQDVTIVAYNEGSMTPQARITIEVLPVAVTEMTLNNTELEMPVGAEASLTVSIVPENASYKNIEWRSSDEGIATVDKDGRVTAVASGSVTITATQPENGISRTCSITVSEPVLEYGIGDYYYSTGKVSSKPDEDEAEYGKVIGVIFSTDNPAQQGDAKLAEAFPGCTHGYVLSTVEYTSSHGYLSNQYTAEWLVKNGWTTIQNESLICGYTNTLAFAAYNAEKGGDYGLMFNASTGIAATHAATSASPEGASTWYIPSYREMKMMYENLAAINASLEAVAGYTITSNAKYWLSSFGILNSYGDLKIVPFDMAEGSWAELGAYSDERPVRVVLAF